MSQKEDTISFSAFWVNDTKASLTLKYSDVYDPILIAASSVSGSTTVTLDANFELGLTITAPTGSGTPRLKWVWNDDNEAQVEEKNNPNAEWHAVLEHHTDATSYTFHLDHDQTGFVIVGTVEIDRDTSTSS